MTHCKVGWKTNLKVGPETAWKGMVGRAVNKN